jgi:hypothetical protein
MSGRFGGRASERSGLRDIAMDAGVQGYVQRLKSSLLDNEKFDRIISELKSDSSIKLGDMTQIAEGFVGRKISGLKGRTDALQKIVNLQALQSRQHAREKDIEGSLKFW